MSSETDFIDVFRSFLHDVVERHGAPQRNEFLDLVDEHLGTSSADCPIVTEQLPQWRLVDADAALEQLVGPDARLLGVEAEHGREGTFRGLLRGRYGDTPVSPTPDHVSMPVGPGLERRVVANGLRLFRYAGAPLALLQRAADERWDRPDATVEVLGADQAVADAFLADLRERMRTHSVLRGQVVTFRPEQFGSSLGGMSLVARPELDAADVVLPDGVLERLERHVIGIGRHRDRLRAAGQHLKRGVLLYGPPGTGKTHTVRYLLGRATGTTVILLSGNTLHLVGVAARMARVLQPAVVVLEDCDLVAEDRGHGGPHDSPLFELLEALDGMDGDADVTFLLTTNRPDLLERALSQRPGRVDLAVEIPRPDAEGRRALFGLYARDLGLSDEALRAAADRAEGVTASFAKELVRRAVLTAADAGVGVADAHLAQALDELLDDRETFTRTLLAPPEQPVLHDEEGMDPWDGPEGWEGPDDGGRTTVMRGD